MANVYIIPEVTTRSILYVRPMNQAGCIKDDYAACSAVSKCFHGVSKLYEFLYNLS
jgi:hypothetical protein